MCESVVTEAGIDLLVKASMRSLILGTAHTAKFSPSPPSHRICKISAGVNGRTRAHLPLLGMSTCSNGKFIHENVVLLPFVPRLLKLSSAWPLHTTHCSCVCWRTAWLYLKLSNWMTDQNSYWVNESLANRLADLINCWQTYWMAEWLTNWVIEWTVVG